MVNKIRIFAVVEKVISMKALKMAALLRCVLIPWNILNYILSVTDIPAKDFYLGTLIGCMPELAVTIIIGLNIENITEIIGGDKELDPVDVVMMLVQLLIAIGVVIMISKESKKQIMKTVKE